VFKVFVTALQNKKVKLTYQLKFANIKRQILSLQQVRDVISVSISCGKQCR